MREKRAGKHQRGARGKRQGHRFSKQQNRQDETRDGLHELKRADARDANAALDFLDQARAAASRDGVELFGPLPASMPRRAGRHHAQLLAQSASRTVLHKFLARWIPAVEALKPRRGLHWSLDVDPQDLM